MSTPWTEEQLRAITTEDRNLLIAAGAGSGKTAVLVARILRRILGEGTTPCNVDKLLIVTFTKAAAGEMRQRLYDALQERLSNPDTDEETSKRIYLQQTLLSKAYITTIHGFCNHVVMANSKESGVDDGFRIGDEAETSLLLKEATEEVCEAFSIAHPELYSSLMDTYGTYRSDEGVLALLMEIVQFAAAFPEPKAWIFAQTSAFARRTMVEEIDFGKTVWGRILLRNMILQMEALTLAVQQLLDIATLYQVDPYIATLEGDLAQFRSAMSRLTIPDLTWAQAQEAVTSISMEKLNVLSSKAKGNLSAEAQDALENFSTRRSDIKKKVTKFQKQYFPDALPTPNVQTELLQSPMSFFGDMACALIDAFWEKKQKRHLMDYGDLEHIAYRVLVSKDEDGNPVPSDVALRYQAQFEEIYIDEYQDTNLIQESILRMVSGNCGTGRQNLFMVGDVKQSVYGFRQACPDLFLEKYRSYERMAEDESSSAAQGDGACICLYKNFRSRKEILQTVNQIFHGLMRENTCGMAYTEEEYLNYGASYYNDLSPLPDCPHPDRSTELVIVNSEGFEDGKLPEIHEVARRIEDMVAQGFPVFDKSIKGLRPIQYGDICILLRSTATSGIRYRDYLLSRGIPAFCQEKGGFFRRPEVRVLLSFLKILDNPRQDIPLLSVLRNIYGFSEELFAQIMLEDPDREKCFWDRLAAYGEKHGGAAQDFLDRYTVLRGMVPHQSVAETVWTCMQENGFFDALGQVPGGDVWQQNLLLLMNRAVRYDTDTHHGLFQFVNRLTALEREGSNIPGAGASADGLDTVQIMTIHGSKGLEFPVVFLCATGAGRDRRDENKKMLIHRDVGFGPTCYDIEKKLIFPSMMRLAVRQALEMDAKAEELRVLYVALTRAREKLIITGSVKQSPEAFLEACRGKCSAEHGRPLDFYVLNTENYLELMGMALAAHPNPRAYTIQGARYTEELEPGNGVREAEDGVVFTLPSMPLYSATEAPVFKTASAAPFAPAKTSVTELKRLRLSWEQDLRSTERENGSREHMGTYTPSQIGTFLHGVLQHVDYKRISANEAEMDAYARELLLQMVDEGFITEAESDSVPVPVLVRYLTSSFAQRLSGAVWMKREAPFTFLVSWKEVSGRDEPGETAVQGVIDLVAEIEGKLVLVDFKSDGVVRDFKQYSQRYSVQMGVYAEACKRAFGRAPDEIYLYYLRPGHGERIEL